MLAFGYTTADNIWGMVSTCKLSILREHWAAGVPAK